MSTAAPPAGPPPLAGAQLALGDKPAPAPESPAAAPPQPDLTRLRAARDRLRAALAA